MKKLISTFGLLMLLMVVTSFTTPNEIGGTSSKPVLGQPIYEIGGTSSKPVLGQPIYEIGGTSSKPVLGQP